MDGGFGGFGLVWVGGIWGLGLVWVGEIWMPSSQTENFKSVSVWSLQGGAPARALDFFWKKEI